MAKIVLRDQIQILGESSERFPHAKVDILLESVAREILDEGIRAQFRRHVFEQMMTLQCFSRLLMKKLICHVAVDFLQVDRACFVQLCHWSMYLLN